MNKYIILTLCLLFTMVAVTADDETFYTALQTCGKYSNRGQASVEGQVAKFENKILGWENNKCVYREEITFSGINSCTTCKFTKNQIDELVKVMRAYTTVQKYSGEDIDTSSLKTLQNNPVANVWNKYLKDSSVCTIEIDN